MSCIAMWDVIQIFVCQEALLTCCVKLPSQGGSLIKLAFLFEVNLTLRSEKSSGWSYIALNTDFLPIPNKAEVESQPVRACTAGRILLNVEETDCNIS